MIVHLSESSTEQSTKTEILEKSKNVNAVPIWILICCNNNHNSETKKNKKTTTKNDASALIMMITIALNDNAIDYFKSIWNPNKLTLLIFSVKSH